MVPSKANEDFLVAEAHAKINLHLEVLGIRSDGFHELAMVMQSINLSDQLRMKKSEDSNITLKSNNTEISNGEDNLIIKAAKLLRNKVGNTELGVDIELEKNIPIGAGLAGAEAAWQAARAGVNVKLFEMRPSKRSPAHHTNNFAELVCSNSVGSLSTDRASGLLKEE